MGLKSPRHREEVEFEERMKNRNLGEKMGQNTKEGDRRQYIVPLKKKKVRKEHLG